jgi:hypothetical protein
VIPYWTVLMEWRSRDGRDHGVSSLADSYHQAELQAEMFRRQADWTKHVRTTIEGPFYRNGFQ